LNQEKFEEGLRLILDAIETRLSRETKRTPARFARACLELFSGYGELPKLRKFKTFHKSIVRFSCLSHTICEHHFLSIVLHVRVSYKPDGYVIGVSKIPRIINYYASRLQLQERLTEQVAYLLYSYIKPKWLRVQIHGLHCCTFARGAKTAGLMTTDVSMPRYMDFDTTFFSKPSVLAQLVGGEAV